MKELSPLLSMVAFATLAALLGPTVATAQATKYENAAQGYRLFVHKALKAVPTEPNERQIVAKWGGSIEFKEKVYRGEDTCTLMLVRIKKAKGPTTGEGGKPKEGEDEADGGKPDDRSVRDLAIESLNSGTTVEEFLKRRGWNSDIKPVDGEKVVKSKAGAEYAVRQLLGQTFDDRKWETKELPSLRTYMLEDATEYFGFVALGPFVEPFRGYVLDAARSLERIQLGTADTGSSDESLSNQGFREQVRAKLVKGWQAYDTPHFIFVTNTKNKSLIDQILVDLELMRDVYLERFPPVEGVDMESVISAVRFCQTYKDYEAYGGPPGTGGYWNYVDEELVLVDVQTLDPAVLKANPNLKNIQVLDVLYHEAMHQYFFYANGNLAPASWYNEGFGEVFGGAVPDRVKKKVARIDRNKFRMAWLKNSQQNQAWPDLKAFLKMSQREFYGASSLQNYAFAWAFCFFLEEHRKDPKGNKEWGAIPDAYLKNLREATDAQREKIGADKNDKKWLSFYEVEIQKVAFEKTFAGVDLLKLEKAWIDAMKKWK